MNGRSRKGRVQEEWDVIGVWAPGVMEIIAVRMEWADLMADMVAKRNVAKNSNGGANAGEPSCWQAKVKCVTVSIIFKTFIIMEVTS